MRVREVLIDGTTSSSGQTADTNSGGNVQIDGLKDGLYEVIVEGRGSTFVRVKDGARAEVQLDSRGLPTVPVTDARLAELVAIANRAAAACEKRTYDYAVEDLERFERMVDVNLARLDVIIKEYETDTGYQANLEQMRSVYRRVARTVMGGRGTTPGTTAAGAGAPIDPNAAKLSQFLSVLEARERLLKQREAVRAARAQVQPFRTDCDKRVGAVPGTAGSAGSGAALAGVPAGPDRGMQAAAYSTAGFYGGVEGGVLQVERPSNSFFRVDAGGSFKSFPALKFKNDDTTGVGRAFLGYRIPTPSLKERSAIGLELHGWYYSGSSRGSQSEFTPGAGETLGLFSPATQDFPFGGYSTGQPLRDISVRSEYSNYGGEFRIQRWCDYDLGDMRVVLEPWVGFRLGRSKVDQSITAGIGNPAFAEYSQSSSIDSTFFGPSLGVGARYEMGNGVFLFGRLGASLDFNRGSGNWSTIVPLVDGDEPRSAKLSNNKTGYSVGGAIGAGYRIYGMEIRATAEVIHSNGSPYLKFASPSDTDSGTGGARIGYGGQTSYGGSLGLRFNF